MNPIWRMPPLLAMMSRPALTSMLPSLASELRSVVAMMPLPGMELG